MVASMLQLLYKMMKCSKAGGEDFQGMGAPHKLLTEERTTFDFIDNLNEIVKYN
jgi:hypothetical protein